MTEEYQGNEFQNEGEQTEEPTIETNGHEKSDTEAMTRRTFVAGMAVAAATAATATVTAPVTAGASTSLGSPVPANMTPGTYYGEAPGHRGIMKVAVTVSENRIEKVEFVEAIPRKNDAVPDPEEVRIAKYVVPLFTETTQMLEGVIDRLGDRIVEHQSLKVDVVCGATATSAGYIRAAEAAIAQSGANMAAFNVEVPKKTDTEEYYGYHVIVVGAGASGILAAANATENGAHVLLIEKSARLGGCGALSSGPRLANSKFHEESGIPFFDNAETLESSVRQGLWQPKANIVSQFLNCSGPVGDFLIEKGDFVFDARPGSLGYVDYALYTNKPYEAWNRVASKIDTIFTETTVKSLIQDANGKVTGVEAERFDGTKIIAHADNAVIVCSGGFLGSYEKQMKYNGDYFSTRFGLAQDIGEGLDMMLAAGAREYHIAGMNVHVTQPSGEIEGFDDFSCMIPHTLHTYPNFMRVNGRGERFSNENIINTSPTGNGNILVPQGRNFYTIVSADQMKILAHGGLEELGAIQPYTGINFNFWSLDVDFKMEKIFEVMEAGVEAGFIFKGDTFEELAGAAGFMVPVFKAHAERYEAACIAKEDDLFNKLPELLAPMGSGPYYAIQCEGCGYSTMGGVEVDEEMRVLGARHIPIPGLYAAGCDTIGVLYGGAAYGDLGGWPFGWACYSGYAAGTSAAGNPIVKIS